MTSQTLLPDHLDIPAIEGDAFLKTDTTDAVIMASSGHVLN
jgi:hypothetical protein